MKTHHLEFREVDRVRFEEVRSGLKGIETRAATDKYRAMEEGDVITCTCGQDSFSKRIVRKWHWRTIEAMLAEVPLQRIMPDVHSLEQARARYATYPGYPEKIATYGIVGFELA
ncbi:hypothetical protein FJY94_00625 [Candidatus Kaiserbacteria bacterium]|nr:hypothetical protein [Candidatus Kaiserbacteria bacterium]